MWTTRTGTVLAASCTFMQPGTHRYPDEGRGFNYARNQTCSSRSACRNEDGAVQTRYRIYSLDEGIRGRSFLEVTGIV
jgi:hypothetical protein